MRPSPINCIPGLLHHLSVPRLTDPFSIINRYNGSDWKHYNVSYPMTLFRNDYLELIISNWRKGKHDLYYNNYSSVCTKVLGGSFNVTETDGKTTAITQFSLCRGDVYTSKPFSKIFLLSVEPSTTLEMIQYHHMY